MSEDRELVLFHYEGSVYARRVEWYLWLRGLPYSQCIQPPYIPRPDLTDLGISYRRIPILAIGRDVYCDSRLIFAKLEELFPNSPLAPPTLQGQGIRKLLEHWLNDSGVFMYAVRLIEPTHPLFEDPKMLDDRQTIVGYRFTKENVNARKPEALTRMTQTFQLLELFLLADGRQYILDTDTLTLADLEVAWMIQWLTNEPYMKDALPEGFFTTEKYPRISTWFQNVFQIVQDQKTRAPRPTTISGAQAKDKLLKSASPQEAVKVEPDQLQLQAGDEVEVWTMDNPTAKRERGALVGLSSNEVTLRNQIGLHLHFPRWNFKIAKAPPQVPVEPTSIAAAAVPANV